MTLKPTSMNVTDINELKYAAEYLKSAANQEQDWNLRSALVNVSCVLEQAIEEHVEDDQHPHLYLNIVKAPTLMDRAIAERCTTDCIHVLQGTCPYMKDEKYKCPRIEEYLSEE
jgi:hypothetical protein